MKPTVRSFLSDDDWKIAVPYLRVAREKKDDVPFLAGLILDIAETLAKEGWRDWMAPPVMVIVASRVASDAILIKHTSEFSEVLAAMYPFLERTGVTNTNPIDDDDVTLKH